MRAGVGSLLPSHPLPGPTGAAEVPGPLRDRDGRGTGTAEGPGPLGCRDG